MKPEVVLVLTLVLGTVGLTAMFWGLALFVQGYLYNQPADKLPLRALAAGLGVAVFLTGWTYLNTRASHVNKYGALHEFSATTQKPVDEFEAVRRLAIKDEKGQPKEVTVPFKWEPGGPGGGRFVEAATGKEFQVNTANYMTVALLVPEAGGKARFNAKLKDGVYAREGDNIRFEEQGGVRYIETSTSNNLRHMEVPSTGGFAVAVAINVLHYVVWFLAFWLGLRFTVGHALGLAAAFGTASMLVLMPLLFERNELKPAVAVPQAQQAAPK
ncbi:MAG TPA: hypothetical protein VFG68_14115 [Fimbriiglobus sp.]|nr:hypothetical protein [Fimbriiglobus sp.]